MPNLVDIVRQIRLEVDLDRPRGRIVVAVHDEVSGHYTYELKVEHVRALSRCLGDVVERYPREFPLSHAANRH